ncbi:hypothetical protein M0804_001258 [Polistes exclamans]|nr:hypothetical protein M0804_001258 [Polistes exclamans]
MDRGECWTAKRRSLENTNEKSSGYSRSNQEQRNVMVLLLANTTIEKFKNRIRCARLKSIPDASILEGIRVQQGSLARWLLTRIGTRSEAILAWDLVPPWYSRCPPCRNLALMSKIDSDFPR